MGKHRIEKSETITAEEIIKIFSFAVNDSPKISDVIVCLKGEGFSRIPKCTDLFNEGYASHILISGGEANETGWSFSADKMAGEFLVRGVPQEAITTEMRSQNTRENMIEVVRLAREKSWKRIILVTNLHHQARAYMALIRAMREAGAEIEIINQPVIGLPWFESTPIGTRIEVFEKEIVRIKEYSEKGHLASFDETVAYQRWKENYNKNK